MRTIRTYSAHGSGWGTEACPTPTAARVAGIRRQGGTFDIWWRDGNADRSGLSGYGAFVASGIYERAPHIGSTTQEGTDGR
jgi:hypothetical protein